VAGTCLLFLLGVGLAGGYLAYFVQKDERRAAYKSVYAKHAPEGRADVKSHTIRVTRAGKPWNGKSELVLTNPTGKPLPAIVLYLNPGLRMQALSVEGKNVSHEREQQVVRVNHPLAPGEEVKLEITYAGTLDDAICYLDVPDGEYYTRPGRQYLVNEGEDVLVTPEALWYPVTIPPVSIGHDFAVAMDFSRYSLIVDHPASLTAISQGSVTRTSKGSMFHHTQDMPGISLCIGRYEHKQVKLQHIDFHLYYYKEHDNFSRVFSRFSPKMLEEALGSKWGYFDITRYPLAYFSLVEAPVNFITQHRSWKGRSENVQPGLLFFPERGSGTGAQAGFGTNIRKYAKLQQEFPGMEMEDEEKQTQALSAFSSALMRGSSIARKENFHLQKIFSLFKEASFAKYFMVSNPCCPSSMLFEQNFYIQDDRIPVLDHVMKMLHAGSYRGHRKGYDRYESLEKNTTWAAMSYLRENNLAFAMQDSTLVPYLRDEILYLKARELHVHLLTLVNEEEWSKFIEEFYKENRFRSVSGETFFAEAKRRFDMDLLPVFQKWYTECGLASFLIQNVVAQRHVTSNQSYSGWEISFQIWNKGNKDGVVNVQLFGLSTRNIPYLVKAGECKEVHLVHEKGFMRLLINTGLSENVPNDYEYMQESIVRYRPVVGMPRDTVFSISPNLFLPDSNEMIVDNEDTGFSLIVPQRGFQSREEGVSRNTRYQGLARPIDAPVAVFPSRWTLYCGKMLHGETKRTVYLKQAGKGNFKARWEVEIPNAGYYRVESFCPNFAMNNMGGEAVYTIYFGEEKEEVCIMQGSGRWTSLGRFYFPKGKAMVELSDKGDGPIVVADAIKWIREK